MSFRKKISRKTLHLVYPLLTQGMQHSPSVQSKITNVVLLSTFEKEKNTLGKYSPALTFIPWIVYFRMQFCWCCSIHHSSGICPSAWALSLPWSFLSHSDRVSKAIKNSLKHLYFYVKKICCVMSCSNENTCLFMCDSRPGLWIEIPIANR